MLVIDKAGAHLLDEEPTSLPEAIARMKGSDPALPVRMLNVIADRSFPAQRFLDIIDELRRGGIPVRIVTLSEKAEG